jgi:hypothetical protein
MICGVEIGYFSQQWARVFCQRMKENTVDAKSEYLSIDQYVVKWNGGSDSSHTYAVADANIRAQEDANAPTRRESGAMRQ